jgi:hypothetical protein
MSLLQVCPDRIRAYCVGRSFTSTRSRFWELCCSVGELTGDVMFECCCVCIQHFKVYQRSNLRVFTLKCLSWCTVLYPPYGNSFAGRDSYRYNDNTGTGLNRLRRSDGLFSRRLSTFGIYITCYGSLCLNVALDKTNPMKHIDFFICSLFHISAGSSGYSTSIYRTGSSFRSC